MLLALVKGHTVVKAYIWIYSFKVSKCIHTMVFEICIFYLLFAFVMMKLNFSVSIQELVLYCVHTERHGTLKVEITNNVFFFDSIKSRGIIYSAVGYSVVLISCLLMFTCPVSQTGEVCWSFGKSYLWSLSEQQVLMKHHTAIWRGNKWMVTGLWLWS